MKHTDRIGQGAARELGGTSKEVKRTSRGKKGCCWIQILLYLKLPPQRLLCWDEWSLPHVLWLVCSGWEEALSKICCWGTSSMDMNHFQKCPHFSPHDSSLVKGCCLFYSPNTWKPAEMSRESTGKNIQRLDSNWIPLLIYHVTTKTEDVSTSIQGKTKHDTHLWSVVGRCFLTGFTLLLATAFIPK